MPAPGSLTDLSDSNEEVPSELPPWFRGKSPESFGGFAREESEQIYDSKWCGLRRDLIRLPDGALQDYHVFEVTDAVVVVPVLPDDSILMIWQYRYPHGRTHWEIPAGRMNAGEEPLDAVARELREETGFASADIQKLCNFFPINGISDHYAHAYVARTCEQVGAPNLDASEVLEVQRFAEADVRELLASGKILDGFSALALHSYFASK